MSYCRKVTYHWLIEPPKRNGEVLPMLGSRTYRELYTLRNLNEHLLDRGRP